MEINQNHRPTIGNILKEGFTYWNKTLFYQLLMSLLYFSVIFLVTYYSAMHFGLMEQYANALGKLKDGQEAYLQEVRKISASEGYQKFYWIFTAAQVFLYPLNFGLFKMYRKIDLGQPIDIQDLFAGYLGSNFFIYTSFFLFWILIYNMMMPTVFLPVVWVLMTVFSGPLMFFMNKRIFEGINLNFQALKKFPAEIIIYVLVAVAMRYAGLLSIAGALFTFPIWTAIVYAMYNNMFSENETKP